MKTMSCTAIIPEKRLKARTENKAMTKKRIISRLRKCLTTAIKPEMGQFIYDLAALICTLILGSSLWLTVMMLGLILEG
jgi:hypothetical protein